MARSKTRSEKMRSELRRGRMAKQRIISVERKSSESFEYLSSKYVRKDLTKTVVFSLLVVVVEICVSRIL